MLIELILAILVVSIAYLVMRLWSLEREVRHMKNDVDEGPNPLPPDDALERMFYDVTQSCPPPTDAPDLVPDVVVEEENVIVEDGVELCCADGTCEIVPPASRPLDITTDESDNDEESPETESNDGVFAQPDDDVPTDDDEESPPPTEVPPPSPSPPPTEVPPPPPPSPPLVESSTTTNKKKQRPARKNVPST